MSEINSDCALAVVDHFADCDDLVLVFQGLILRHSGLLVLGLRLGDSSFGAWAAAKDRLR